MHCSTVYIAARRSLASYDECGKLLPVDYTAGAKLVGYYIRFHLASGLEAPERADGALKFGKRIRVLARCQHEKQQRLFDITADGRIVNPNGANIDPATGMEKV